MKATLKFNLDDPDDRESHLRCIKAPDMVSVLWDFDQFLREGIKYNGENWDDIRSNLARLMNENNINLDELIS